MKELPIKKYVIYLFWTAILIFLINKFYLRPWVLENEPAEVLRIFVLSVPNLVEAMVGTLLLTGILLHIRQYYNSSLGHIHDTYVHLTAVGIAAAYSISQEYRLHNLGGNNVFDVNDVFASIIGLSLAFGIIQKFGFIATEN